MPRARNLKHSFFTNDQLAENDPLGRLLFMGLWTLADFKGDIEWREKRIKAQILPYDNCDIKKLAINLDLSGFIRFYSNGDNIYVNIITFGAHQNPHKNERLKGSDIPGYTKEYRQLIDLKGLAINHDKSGLKPECSASDPAESCSLNPESCSLNPESCSLNPEKVTATKTPKKKPETAKTWKAYIAEYFHRYRVEPLRNVTVNSQMAKFCKQLPIEDAPHVAEFYVTHNDNFYVKQSHPVGLLLKDVQKLHTEWSNGTHVTSSSARQVEDKQTTLSTVDRAIAKLENTQ